MPRYIDADKLRQEWLENGENEHVYDTNAFLDSIDNQPTADVAEVVHGEWVDNGVPESILDGCSSCGFPCGAYTFNFCPHCGAKMDLEKEKS